MIQCQQTQECWDDYRDGRLDESLRSVFEAHLATCEACGAMWKAENGWLEDLRRSASSPAGRDEADGRRFAAGVIARWQGMQRPAVIGRIGPGLWVGAAAAAALAVVLSVWAMVQINRAVISPTGPGIAKTTTPIHADVDPVGELVVNFSDQVFLAQPVKFQKLRHSTEQLLQWRNLADVLKLPPGEETEPGSGKQTMNTGMMQS